MYSMTLLLHTVTLLLSIESLFHASSAGSNVFDDIAAVLGYIAFACSHIVIAGKKFLEVAIAHSQGLHKPRSFSKTPRF
jgi:hypothetical protein